MINKIKLTFSKIIFRFWPSHVGLDFLRTKLYLPPPPEVMVLTSIRGFPLKLRQLLKPGMTFVDIGANIGLYSIIGAYLTGNDGKVIAFEPQKKLCDILYENINLNNFTNIEVYPCALSDEAKNGKIYQVSTSNDGQATIQITNSERIFGEPLDIKICTLDTVMSENNIDYIDGIKIDVEGAELNVLKGLSSHLKKDPPRFIFFECINEHLKRFNTNTDELITFLIDHNFSIFCLHYGKWHKISSNVDHEKQSFASDMLALYNYE